MKWFKWLKQDIFYDIVSNLTSCYFPAKILIFGFVRCHLFLSFHSNWLLLTYTVIFCLNIKKQSERMQVLVPFIHASKYYKLVDKSDPVCHFEIFDLIFFLIKCNTYNFSQTKSIPSTSSKRNRGISQTTWIWSCIRSNQETKSWSYWG